jgi:hypothetical protein
MSAESDRWRDRINVVNLALKHGGRVKECIGNTCLGGVRVRQLGKGYSYAGAIGAKGPMRGVITSRGIASVGGLVRSPAWTRPIVVKPSSVGERREMLESVGVSSGGCILFVPSGSRFFLLST